MLWAMPQTHRLKWPCSVGRRLGEVFLNSNPQRPEKNAPPNAAPRIEFRARFLLADSKLSEGTPCDQPTMRTIRHENSCSSHVSSGQRLMLRGTRTVVLRAEVCLHALAVRRTPAQCR
jgi:hypothetical protein